MNTLVIGQVENGGDFHSKIEDIITMILKVILMNGNTVGGSGNHIGDFRGVIDVRLTC